MTHENTAKHRATGRGLMARPRLLLLDEPSLGVAPLLVQQIFETLTRINRGTGTTLLVVERNAYIALKNSHFGYVLQVGKVAGEGKAEELRQNREAVESYMGTQNKVASPCSSVTLDSYLEQIVTGAKKERC